MDLKIHAAIRAAEDGEDTAQDIVRNCTELNATDKLGNTPLTTATILGKHDICKTLLDFGADVNRQNNSGMTPLLLASEGGHYLLAKIFLRSDAHIDKPDRDGMTPLMWAAWSVHPECVALLVGEGANVNVRCNAGLTALTYAAGEVPPVSVSGLFGRLDAMGRMNSRMIQMLRAIQEEQATQRAEIVEFLTIRGAIS